MSTTGAIVRILIGIAFAALAAYFVIAHPAELERLRGIGWPVAGGILLLRVASGLLHAISQRLLFRSFGRSVPLPELILLNTGGTIANLLAPLAGASMKALLLKKRHEVDLSEFAGAMGALGALRIIAAGLAALVGMSLLLGVQTLGVQAWLYAAGTTLLGVALLAGAAPISRVVQRLRMLRRLSEAWQILVGDRRTLTLVSMLTVVRTLIGFVAFGWLVLAMGAGSLAAGGTMGSVAQTLEIVKVTPGNLGSYELLAGATGEALGISLTTGVLVAAVARLFGYGSMLLLAVAALPFAGHRD